MNTTEEELVPLLVPLTPSEYADKLEEEADRQEEENE